MINRDACSLLRSNRLVDALSRMLTALLVLMLVHAPPSSAQSPTVSELLEVCERGRIQGWQGVDAAFCDWFALPCDCKMGGNEEFPRWCLPQAEDALDAARARVIAELKRLDGAVMPAEAAVARLLQRLYPCTNGSR
jgi:hypothetical protein